MKEIMGGEEKGKKVINRKKETKENEKKERKKKEEMEERSKKKAKNGGDAGVERKEMEKCGEGIEEKGSSNEVGNTLGKQVEMRLKRRGIRLFKVSITSVTVVE